MNLKSLLLFVEQTQVGVKLKKKQFVTVFLSKNLS